MGDLVIPAKLATTAVAWEGDTARGVAGAPARGSSPRWRSGGTSRSARRSSPAATSPGWRPLGAGRDGLDAVLKLQLPHPESAPEAVGLRAWAGDGAVRLHDHDPERWALLIERCRPGHGLDRRGRHAGGGRRRRGASARGCTRAAPPDGLPTSTDGARRLGRRHRGAARRRAPGRDPALVAPGARRRCATRPARAASPVLLHGDLNPTNVLAAEREPWLAIDPKPMVGDPAYDGPRLVTQPDPLRHARPRRDARRAARRSSPTRWASTGTRCCEWCLVDAVEIGASPGARRRARRPSAATPTWRSSRRSCRDRRARRALGRPGARAGRPRAAAPPARRSSRRWPSRSSRCWPRAAAWPACSPPTPTRSACCGSTRRARIRPPALGDLVTWKRRELLRIAGPRPHRRRRRSRPPPRRSPTWRPTCCGVVVDTAGDGLGADDRLAVIGMGKLGGAELNYASDVDVVLVGEGDIERLERAARAVLDRAGRAFRVDADLRPEGRDGPLVRTLGVLRGVLGSGGRSRGSARRSSRRARWPATAALGDGVGAERRRASCGTSPSAPTTSATSAPSRCASEEEVEPRRRRPRREARPRRHPRHRVRRAAAPARARARRRRAPRSRHARGARRAPPRRLRGPRPTRRASPTRTASCDGSSTSCSSRTSARCTRCPPTATAAGAWRGCSGSAARRRPGPPRRSTRRSPPTGCACAAPTSGCGSGRCSSRSPAPARSGEAATAERLAAFGFADVERTRQAVAELTRGLTRSSRMMQQLLPLLLDWLSASPDPDLGLLGPPPAGLGRGAQPRAGHHVPRLAGGGPPPRPPARHEPPARRRAPRQPRPHRAAPRPEPAAHPRARRPRRQRARA